MVHDIFFDCPQCNHTIKVSSDLVGVMVECPDCANEFHVPEIRDGLNPRFRSRQGNASLSLELEKSQLLEDMIELEKGLRSLLRRQKEQIKQTDFIEGNANLVLKQLRLIYTSSSSKEPAPLPTGIDSEESTHSSASPWLRYSWVCGWLTLGAIVVFAAFYLRTL